MPRRRDERRLEMKRNAEWGKNKGPLAFCCCANESHFVFSVSVLLLSPSLSVLCVYCPLSLTASTFLTRAFLFLMENKDRRVAEIGLQMKNMESVTWGQGLSVQAPKPESAQLSSSAAIDVRRLQNVDVKKKVLEGFWAFPGRGNSSAFDMRDKHDPYFSIWQDLYLCISSTLCWNRLLSFNLLQK